MRAAHIINNKIVNIIEVEDLSFPVEEGFLIEDTGEEDKGGFAELEGNYKDGKFSPRIPSNAEQSEKRKKAYEQESDPLFMKYQRGEVTKEQWEAKVAEIVRRYPYYEV